MVKLNCYGDDGEMTKWWYKIWWDDHILNFEQLIQSHGGILYTDCVFNEWYAEFQHESDSALFLLTWG